MILATSLPVSRDEALYWLWSRRLAASYRDHPPLIAFLIALTTLPGDSPFWLRLGPLLIAGGTTYATFLLGRELFDARVGFIAAVLFQLVPVLGIRTVMATPDAPLLLLWVLALRFVWQALHGHPARWIWAGVATGLGLLTKLTATLLVPGVGLHLLRRARAWLSRRQPYLALLAALLLSLPVVYWNATHGWVGMRFAVRLTLVPRMGGDVGRITEYLGWTLALLPAFVWAALAAWRRRADERFAFLCWTAAPSLVFILVTVAVTGTGYGNWVAPAFLELTIILAALWNRPTAVLAAINALAVALGLASVAIPSLPAPRLAADVYGCRETAARVRHDLAATRGPAVVAVERWPIGAMLGYCLGDTYPVVLLPKPPRGSIWSPIEAFAGANAIAVIDARRRSQVDWTRYAARVEELPPVEVRARGRVLRTFRVFRLHRLRNVGVRG